MQSGAQISGRLKLTTLGDVLGTLSRHKASGTLELTEGTDRQHRIVLREGHVVHVEVDRASASLGEILRKDFELPETVLRRSLLRALSSRRLHGEVLKEEFGVSGNVIDLGLRRQMLQRLTLIEQLPDAQVAFRARGWDGPAVPLTSAEFLQGRKRARDTKYAASDRPAAVIEAARSDSKRRMALRQLGLSDGASETEVKKAYRGLVKELHPDTNQASTADERESCTRDLEAVTTAYQSLVA
jgi:DnaJ-domain-containing protein 1